MSKIFEKWSEMMVLKSYFSIEKVMENGFWKCVATLCVRMELPTSQRPHPGNSV